MKFTKEIVGERGYVSPSYPPLLLLFLHSSVNYILLPFFSVESLYCELERSI